MGRGVEPSIGLIGAAVVGLLVLLSGAAVWLAFNPPRLARPRRLGDVPLVGAALNWAVQRWDGMSRPLQARWGLGGVAVAGMAGGLLAVALMAVGFTALLDDVLEGEGLARVDEPAAGWLAGHREAWLTRVLLVITRLGNTDAQAACMVVVCLLAALTARAWAPIAVGVTAGGGIGVVIVVAKHLVGRDRPDLPFAVMAVDGFSFPSGHATGAAAVGLVCAWMVCRWVTHCWALQVAVWAVTLAAIGLIGFSRAYLGVHFLTDVLAGWMLGVAWAVAVIVIASWWTGNRDYSRTPTPQRDR